MASKRKPRLTLEHTPDVEIPEWALELHFEMADISRWVSIGQGAIRYKTSRLPGVRRGV